MQQLSFLCSLVVYLQSGKLAKRHEVADMLGGSLHCTALLLSMRERLVALICVVQQCYRNFGNFTLINFMTEYFVLIYFRSL